MKNPLVVFLSCLGLFFIPLFGLSADLKKEAADFYFSHQPDKALKNYLTLAKETKTREAFLNAAFIALEQNKTHQAVDIAMAGYHLYPDDIDMADFLAEALLADGQYSAAERVLGLDPFTTNQSGLYYIQLARAQMGLEEPQLAKFNLIQATYGDLYRPLAYYLLGTIYQQENNWEQAIEAFNQAITEDHQFTEARRALALSLEKAGKALEALRQYNMLYATDKNEPNTQEAVTRLRRLFPNVKSGQAEQPQPVTHTLVTPVHPTGSSDIRIGLGVEINGKPSQQNTWVFSPSHAFTVVNEKNIKIASGKAKEVWKAVLTKKQASLIAPNGKKYAFKTKITIVPLNNEGTKEPTFILKNVVSGAGMTWMSVSDKEYRGKLEIVHNSNLNTLVPINIISLEGYLQGVISSEMPTGFPLEALKAQAILARTYALYHAHKHKSYGYDLCDSQNCQVYGGVQAETEAGNEAVTSTLQEVLRYQGKPIEAVFSANTGGITQSAKDAGWNETPYLQPVTDYKIPVQIPPQPYQFRSFLQNPPPAYGYYDKNVSLAAFRWARVVSAEDIQHIIKRKYKDIGTITQLLVEKRNESGYVTKLLVKGTQGSVTLTKENVIRNSVSVGMLRSNYFIVVPQYTHRKLTHFIFYGGGWGHGVGFDQTGAAGRAESGQKYPEILHHYFPLTELFSLEKEVNSNHQ